ncbi:hypothetical protein [Mesorhizobium sp.]|uniref:hypothetical protein n=1 Tax=Mesorhizobium sp. TaxID=1871066 RepID=UPI000FE345AF|nr:hypothetical protein [Mesorhizobium sp.]RWC01479.1 MAG: hypothetical protein EOQ56_13325 [Mesorhizobium sp.]RWP34135.1 MAG: hypothetical protein EOR02_00795 [Mesorhizobium sp.]RWQ22675.1 MAG: hypothetical protein EOR92_06515 [Mesorhizobium sp.]
MASRPVDFRKGPDGLAALVRDSGADPFWARAIKCHAGDHGLDDDATAHQPRIVSAMSSFNILYKTRPWPRY